MALAKNLVLFLLSSYLISILPSARSHRLFTDLFDPYEIRFGHFSDKERLHLRDEAKHMFEFGYDNYMRHAFPMDELDPIHCTGRGPDYDDPSNININDALGDYCLTLVDALDTLAIMGNVTEFRRAVELAMEYVRFDNDNTVQVFEATIRVIGGLLSAHLIITDEQQVLGNFSIPGYDNELLHLAHDLASRLLPAFENTKTGLPYPRVNLVYGVPWSTVNETCTAGAGSLLLEFGMLSRLLKDSTYEGLARKTNKILWNLRNKDTGLLGYTIDIQTGEWTGLLSGIGAGLDSFYEYLLKAYILFGDLEDYRMFNESYYLIKEFMRRGRAHCNMGHGDHPIYVNVHMKDGSVVNTWIDALQAAFAGVQILTGDVEEAICAHLLYYNIWRKYGVIPERFNWKLKAPDVAFYPLRPEFAEVTYFLYMATKNPFYLHVGKDIIESLNRNTKAKCGYATIHSVEDMSLEDRMESFFLSETCKYLYLLFAGNDNPVNKNFARYLFSTEGHLFPVDRTFRDFPVDSEDAQPRGQSHRMPADSRRRQRKQHQQQPESGSANVVDGNVVTVGSNARNISIAKEQCHFNPLERRFHLPIRSHYFRQLEMAVGVSSEWDTFEEIVE